MSQTSKTNNSDYIIDAFATLKDAMTKITVNHRGCVVVVDNNMLVVGVLSDGDIRRAMVKGATTFTPVDKAMNQNFVSMNEEEKNREEEFFKENANINVVPIVDRNNKLVDVLIRGGVYK